MDEKLNSTLDKIIRLCGQNAEFDKELRKRLGVAPSASVLPISDERIDQIYEYCIEKVVRKQAREFYSDFPVSSIRDGLMDDFCRMEAFRRKDNFGDFCLSLYQQIESMTNSLCTNPDLDLIAERMWGYPAYIKTGTNIKPSLEKRAESDYLVASLVFPGNDKETGLSNATKKSKQALQTLYAKDKIRCVVYFLGYKAAMKSSDFDSYIEFTSLLADLYQCRNMNHRGNKPTQWEKETLDRILPSKAVYYLKFLGVLTLYVEQIKEGWKNLPTLKKYALSLSPKEVKITPKPKVIGKMVLPEDNKKRYK